jgi:hypothetical protein
LASFHHYNIFASLNANIIFLKHHRLTRLEAHPGKIGDFGKQNASRLQGASGRQQCYKRAGLRVFKVYRRPENRVYASGSGLTRRNRTGGYARGLNSGHS